MTLKEYDVVRLTRDLPEHHLQKGAIGAVVMLYSSPSEAYEVEFCDNEGITIALATLRAEDLEWVSSHPT